MKMEAGMTVAGISMFVTGLVMYYSVEIGQTDALLRFIKNAGTFTGLCGMGVTVAGILLYLVNKNDAPIVENFDA